ncbi:MAG: radical SAM protein [Desulfarculaceae bacterium]|nr:radical SAM protein [Desulfarculaceae bacterium]MCF8074097.1 radical SAM protein [Desulfarculaceae bacterium]MCF8103780.1 radical SAM protein [Desulfarculaceae bacterium]MCF8116831.1 radical SAM protein [Desulfarculaceae bacterium]
MPSFRVKNLAISIDKQGAGDYAKATYPIRFGKYSEIRTPDYEFHFNQKGEIRFIRGLGMGWRHPGELLKRTDGNDWVYYSLGSVGERIKDLLGEYYLPCLPYLSNSIWEFNPFNDVNIMQAFGAWAQTWATLVEMPGEGLPQPVAAFREMVAANHDTALHQSALELRAIGGERISVLPPDTRHVDYEVIPLMVADGCRYHCGFCCVKSPTPHRPRPWKDIQGQIDKLKAYYGPNLSSYKALFLGNHDALGAGGELLGRAAEAAVEGLGLQDPQLFMFGSADSLLECPESLLARLDRLGGRTYINLGLESVDQATLAAIKKPLSVARVKEAFQRMLRINRDYEGIEVTANFLLGEMFSTEHYDSLSELLAGAEPPPGRKGAVYLSPLLDSPRKPELLPAFSRIKQASRLPAYIYLIQRL